MKSLTVEFGPSSVKVGKKDKGDEYYGIYTGLESRMIIALLNEHAKIRIAQYVAIADVPDILIDIIMALPAANMGLRSKPLSLKEAETLFGECGEDFSGFAKKDLEGIKSALLARKVVFS